MISVFSVITTVLDRAFYDSQGPECVYREVIGWMRSAVLVGVWLSTRLCVCFSFVMHLA